MLVQKLFVAMEKLYTDSETNLIFHLNLFQLGLHII